MKSRMFHNSVSTKYILADYQKWKGRWVHWSTTPYLKLNPQPGHQDPAGIYLFPEKFRTAGSWHAKPFKFIVEVPEDLKVLDLAEISTAQSALELLEKLGTAAGAEFPDFKRQIEKSERHVADIMWEYLQRFFMGRQGLFNKRLRQLGYDAVFDDTESIHSSEVQLLLLDPRKVKIVEREDKKGSGIELVTEILDMIASKGKKYSSVVVHRPKKKFEMWDKAHTLAGYVKVGNDQGAWEQQNYVNYRVEVRSDPYTQQRKFKNVEELKRTHLPPHGLIVEVSSSKPSRDQARKENNYIEFSYRADLRDVDKSKIEEMVDKTLQYVFSSKTEGK